MHYFSGKGCSESLESMHYCIGILKKICLGVIDGSVVFENQSIGVAALIFYTLMRMYRH